MMDVRKMASLGQKAMRQQQSDAEKVFWPLKAGRPRQLKPGLLEAVQLGRATANRLFAAVTEAGLNLTDAGCQLVCAVDGKVFPTKAFSVEHQDSSDLQLALAIHNGKAEPIGVAFLLLDREKGNVLMHARTFQPEIEHARLVESVLDEWAPGFKKRGASC
jgi:hypothetical protein